MKKTYHGLTRTKSINQGKDAAFKIYHNNSNNIGLECRLKYLLACLNLSFEVPKGKYYHNTVNKLINTKKISEVYWSLSTIFLNNKKIPIILPLFYENRFIIDFEEKVKLFNFNNAC